MDNCHLDSTHPQRHRAGSLLKDPLRNVGALIAMFAVQSISTSCNPEGQALDSGATVTRGSIEIPDGFDGEPGDMTVHFADGSMSAVEEDWTFSIAAVADTTRLVMTDADGRVRLLGGNWFTRTADEPQISVNTSACLVAAAVGGAAPFIGDEGSAWCEWLSDEGCLDQLHQPMSDSASSGSILDGDDEALVESIQSFAECAFERSQIEQEDGVEAEPPPQPGVATGGELFWPADSNGITVTGDVGATISTLEISNTYFRTLNAVHWKYSNGTPVEISRAIVPSAEYSITATAVGLIRQDYPESPGDGMFEFSTPDAGEVHGLSLYGLGQPYFHGPGDEPSFAEDAWKEAMVETVRYDVLAPLAGLVVGSDLVDSALFHGNCSSQLTQAVASGIAEAAAIDASAMEWAKILVVSVALDDEVLQYCLEEAVMESAAQTALRDLFRIVAKVWDRVEQAEAASEIALLGAVALASDAETTWTVAYTGESDACEDLLDNDGDGWVDGDDPDCGREGMELGYDASYLCNDGVDNDGDGLVDSEDSDCTSAEDDETKSEEVESDCGDGIDNDEDGAVDCDDPDCVGTEDCQGDGPSGTWSLADADATMIGEEESDNAGDGVAFAGDLNADGFDDLLVGAGDAGSEGRGAVYVVEGPLSGTTYLAESEAILIGSSTSSNMGTAVAGIGDVNGDGWDDIAVGDDNDDAGGGYSSGIVHVLFGPVSGSISLEDADATFTGTYDSICGGAFLGSSIEGGGDLTGDGFPDMIVGAEYDDTHSYNGGAVWVLSGLASSGEVSESATAMISRDQNYASLGHDVSSIADFNGDGIMDFACSAESDATAQVYVFFGPISGTTMAMDADAKMGDKSSASIAFGDALDAAGDTNGDGIDDLAVGAPDHGVAGGGAMLFLGPLVDSESGDAAAHWTSSTGSQPGAAIAGGGDVDGDGLSDWLIGDYGNDEVAESAGAAYLIYGGLTGSYDLEVAGAVFQGEQEKSWAGCSVDIGGDVDGDDHADLLIGAQGGPYVGLDDPGRAYLIFGGP